MTYDALYVEPSEIDTRAVNTLFVAHRDRDTPLTEAAARATLLLKHITPERLGMPLGEAIQTAYSLAMLERDKHGDQQARFIEIFGSDA